MARLRILIVTGEAAGARELEARLTALGYEVAAGASSGRDASTAAVPAAADVALIDVALEGAMSGVAAAEAIRRQRSIPIVFTGPAAEEESVQRAGAADPHGYLVPPFGDRELRASIELAVCRHRSARAVHDLEGFFAVSLDMFCFLDFNGYFRRLNPAWERALGYTREELMSRPFIEFVHPDDRERTLKQNAEVRGGGQATEFENRYVCKDGTHRWFLWNAAPQSTERVIYSVARDITARKQAEAERAELVRRLEASLAEVETLKDILPICLYCKKIRDDRDYWLTVESYISQHTKTRFSHGICPSCMATEVEPELDEFDRE